MRRLRTTRDRRETSPALDEQPGARALVVLGSVGNVFAAERLLAGAGYGAHPVAPPSHLRTGCDLALLVNLVEQAGIARLLAANGLPVIEFIPLDGEVKTPLDIVKTARIDDYLMVRAGNMKLTFHPHTGVIVNISGGGCPDVPYLHHRLVGQPLATVTPPSALGFTLCALMLQRAYEEALTLLHEGDDG